MVEVVVRENEATAVLVGVVIGPDCFLDGLFLVKQLFDVLVLQLWYLHLVFIIWLDLLFVELDR